MFNLIFCLNRAVWARDTHIYIAKSSIKLKEKQQKCAFIVKDVHKEN